jgi:hypothetical protein
LVPGFALISIEMPVLFVSVMCSTPVVEIVIVVLHVTVGVGGGVGVAVGRGVD